MTLRNYNNVTTIGTLSAPLASSATSISTTGFSGFPAAPFTVTLDRNTATEEICLVTSVAGSVLTVTRGYDGTAGIAHTAGATIEHTAGAIEYREANSHVNATVGVHGTTGDLVGDQGAQSIFDKTLVSPVAQADVTAGDAVVAFDPTGTRNLFRGINSNGDDVITVDANGGVHAPTVAVTGATTLSGALAANGGITVPAGKTLTASGGLTASSATVSGNETVGGTLGVTGAATFTGALNANGGATITGTLTANGGVTVPTGKVVAITDAPAVGTSASNKTYVDAQLTAAKAYTDTKVAGLPTKIAAGNISSGSISAGANSTSVNVPFGVTFTTTPIVTVTGTTSGNDFEWFFWVTATSTTNATVLVHWTAATGGAPTTAALNFNWIAVGN